MTRGPGTTKISDATAKTRCCFTAASVGMPFPQGDDVAFMLFGDADGIGHVAHIDDHFGIARHDFFEGDLGIGGQGIAEYVFAAGDFDDFV